MDYFLVVYILFVDFNPSILEDINSLRQRRRPIRYLIGSTSNEYNFPTIDTINYNVTHDEIAIRFACQQVEQELNQSNVIMMKQYDTDSCFEHYSSRNMSM